MLTNCVINHNDRSNPNMPSDMKRCGITYLSFSFWKTPSMVKHISLLHCWHFSLVNCLHGNGQTPNLPGAGWVGDYWLPRSSLGTSIRSRDLIRELRPKGCDFVSAQSRHRGPVEPTDLALVYSRGNPSIDRMRSSLASCCFMTHIIWLSTSGRTWFVCSSARPVFLGADLLLILRLS